MGTTPSCEPRRPVVPNHQVVFERDSKNDPKSLALPGIGSLDWALDKNVEQWPNDDQCPFFANKIRRRQPIDILPPVAFGLVVACIAVGLLGLADCSILTVCLAGAIAAIPPTTCIAIKGVALFLYYSCLRTVEDEKKSRLNVASGDDLAAYLLSALPFIVKVDRARWIRRIFVQDGVIHLELDKGPTYHRAKNDLKGLNWYISCIRFCKNE